MRIVFSTIKFIHFVETLEKNHYNSFNTIHISLGAKKSIIIDINAKILLNLILRTPFHDIITTKYVPPDLIGDPPKPSRCVTIVIGQPVVPYFRPFKRPFNYPKYKKDFDSNAHV